ncbi:MAG: mannose-1-phosphate guanylyltransferase/mannose-6-phosphate isomerase [Candidatus Altiarchaeota archaeon]|nr:mannose-1-phosphate guanylyltransferase/mannose-6-phosphate isomerase [Candidatus Altiarchaeota archaeon]
MPKAIILAGGVGSRLWPLSREAYPKQFIQLFDGSSLFQKTVERMLPIFGPEDILVSTGERYKFIVQNQLDAMKLEMDKDQIVVEPEGKSTLPALLLCMHKFGKGEYGVFPSDHSIDDDGGLQNSIQHAQAITNGHIISFGFVPHRPHTGLGYIKPGAPLGKGFKVDKFIEKPNLELAKRYVDDGYFWNAGMLYTKSKNFLKEVELLSPEHMIVHDEGASAYSKIKEVQLEYAILEKTKKAAVVPISSYWNDLGSFSSFFEVLDNNGGSIVTNTEVLDVGAKDSLVISEENKLVGLVDVKDLIVVDTRDALFVGSRHSSERVKEVFKYLKSKGDTRAKYHTTIYRPWGFFTLMENDSRYKVKKVIVYPGKRMTMHRHYNRTEHWIVAKGAAQIEIGGVPSVIGPGESVYVPRGAAHMIQNPGKTPLEMIEVQIGDHLVEEDVERVGDDMVEL